MPGPAPRLYPEREPAPAPGGTLGRPPWTRLPWRHLPSASPAGTSNLVDRAGERLRPMYA